ncbi:hypothetical protein ACFRU3_37365 [Streptomyces sp. NPDC056910]|uniref:hypothetical protein n=1 Tax=Streptomyces sp. NPDC056910 TaxID=3345964 RepID=UPI0036BF1986
MTDALILSQQMAPYITAALSSYGTAVLDRSIDLSADATVSLGQRLLGRLLRRTTEQSEQQAPLMSALQELAQDPSDAELQMMLQLRLKRLLLQDSDLIHQLADLMPNQGVTITASGERSVAAHTIHGGVRTGDHNG